LIVPYYRIANPKLRRPVAALTRHAWPITEAVGQLFNMTPGALHRQNKISFRRRSSHFENQVAAIFER
jgi:hypothetical protein